MQATSSQARSPGPAVKLRLENDLLTDELRRLRMHVKQLERAQADMEAGGSKAAAQLRKARAQRDRQKILKQRALKKLRDAEREAKRSEEYKRAHGDLIWLLQRLNGSALGIFLRRRKGFAGLVSHYLS